MASSEKMNSEDAEILKRFSQELASLYESKPPVSKAKMMQLTKVAMKGIKYYKHVVMAVEKFIHRCKAEYKLPGLYVVDSIVRQSKHQFGAEKDVFAPRFGKNLDSTLQAATLCTEDDKPKVLRMLNLWLQNNVFNELVLKSAIDQMLVGSKGENVENINSSVIIKSAKKHESGHTLAKHDVELERGKTDMKAESRKKSEFNRTSKPTPPTLSSNPDNVKLVDPSLLQQIQKLTSTLITQQNRKSGESERKLTKRILVDYEYSDDEEESLEEENSERAPNSTDDKEELSANLAAAAQNLLNNPQILQQIQKMQQSIRPSPVVPPASTSSSATAVPPPPPSISTAESTNTSASFRRQALLPSATSTLGSGVLAPPMPTPMVGVGSVGGRCIAPRSSAPTAASIVDFSVPPPNFQRRETSLAAAPPAPPDIHPQIPFPRPFESQAVNCPPPAEPLPPGFDGSGRYSRDQSEFNSREQRRNDYSRERTASRWSSDIDEKEMRKESNLAAPADQHQFVKSRPSNAMTSDVNVEQSTTSERKIDHSGNSSAVVWQSGQPFASNDTNQVHEASHNFGHTTRPVENEQGDQMLENQTGVMAPDNHAHEIAYPNPTVGEQMQPPEQVNESSQSFSDQTGPFLGGQDGSADASSNVFEISSNDLNIRGENMIDIVSGTEDRHVENVEASNELENRHIVAAEDVDMDFTADD